MSEAHPPQLQLIQMATAYWAPRYLHLAAQLKLADCLADGPRTAEQVAQATSTHAPSLYRFLRTLASLGLFTEDADHRFSLTPMGDLLRTGTQHSLHTSVLVLAGGWFAHALDQLLYSLQTGNTAFEKTFEMPLFDWLAKHPQEASQFSETMVGIHGTEPGAVASTYDFSKLETIVDVGGATGNLLTSILARHPAPRGILFDRPHVVRDAPAFIQARGLTARIAIESGNFFESVPAGGDAYLLSHIIHDWGEAQCLTILGNIRRAMKPSSRLLIIEMVLPSGDTPHPGKMLDIIMLAVPGGQERAEPEYRALLEKAGFRLERVVPTPSAVSVVEAFPA
jgi:O-methyltransferase domain/Dimerisation domain